MASGKKMKSSKVVKRSTPSSRRHHFESFSERISNITIDPVRRVRRHDLDDEETTASYFKTSLEEWKDLNLSENFTNFARQATPLCESLPQIVHFQDRLMDLLVEHLEKRDAFSLEPLLSLLSHFAHDLGASFEKHFARAVTIVSAIAARHSDVEVIEWSFTCLAWLFKFLSRLLVPDLRPLYTLMAPLLGKESQKPFIIRFAAEAMSFLVRKAAVSYHRDVAPLDSLISHAYVDLRDRAQTHQVGPYQMGLMFMFSEAIKGVNRGIQSSGTTTFRVLLKELSQSNGSPWAEEVVCGVLVNLIHHTEMDSFTPIMDVVVEHAESMTSSSKDESLRIATRLIYTTTGVRKGTRVGKWNEIMDCTVHLLERTSEAGDIQDATIIRMISTIALTMQYSPIDVLIPLHRKIMDILIGERYRSRFLTFCDIYADLGAERFQEIVLPYFQKYVVAHWESNEKELCILIYKLSKHDQLSRIGTTDGLLSCPTSWQRHIAKAFEELEQSILNGTFVHRDYPMYQMYLNLYEAVSLNPPTRDRIVELVRSFVLYVLKEEPLIPSHGIGFFIMGKCIDFLGSHDPILDPTAFPHLCARSTHFGRLPLFLQGLLKYVKKCGSQIEPLKSEVDPLFETLISNMTTESHLLRSLSLQILGKLYTNAHGVDCGALSTALQIEDTPVNLQTIRAVSMHVRRLASDYSSVNSWIKKAIVSFLFGLLTVKFAQLWDDTCEALRDICDAKGGEDVVAEIAFRWLGPYAPMEDTEESENDDAQKNVNLTPFQCSNLIGLEDHSLRTMSATQDAGLFMERVFNKDLHLVPQTPSAARTQALRVLSKIPHIAEKRSRGLVPMFLRWASLEDDATVKVAEPDDLLIPYLKWSRKDQKAMLEVFAQFQNPKVLYKSSEVYAALLTLLSSGDIDIQKSALKAIFAWKSPGIRPYEENLVNLLDDARFREELSVFLQVDEDESTIQREHKDDLRPVLAGLLYGKVISRKGSASGNKGQEAKRKAVLESVARLGKLELRMFLQIALGPLTCIPEDANPEDLKDVLDKDFLPPRKQLGLVNMLDDMLDTLGAQLDFCAASIRHALLYCLIRASRILGKASKEESDSATIQLSLLKSVRQIGFRALNSLFGACPGIASREYMPLIFEELINPRLDLLPIQTAQSVSGVLQLFSTFSSSPATVFYLAEYNGNLLKKVAECLTIPSAKDEVKLFILRNILKKIIGLAETKVKGAQNDRAKDMIAMDILQPNVDYFLIALGDILRKSPTKEVLETGVDTVSKLAPFVVGSSESRNLLDISVFLLDQPSKRVTPKTKSDLLRILEHFVPLYDLTSDTELHEHIFRTLSSLFGFFRDRTSRDLLAKVFAVFSRGDSTIEQAAKLCTELNSFSATRLDEPDFDRRLKAFSAINEQGYKSLNVNEWRPILFNMLFYIKDEDELAIRTNASFAIRRLIDSTCLSSDQSRSAFLDVVTSILVPALFNGARESSELVRTEYVAVMAHLIKSMPDLSQVNDMEVLLVGGDEEASFFSNILHIQQHRRLRALRRLAAEAQQGHLQSGNISHFFIPLIEHYIFDKADDESAHNLAAEAVLTIGALAEGLEWPQYRAMFRRFSSYMQSKPDMEKTIIKLLGVVIDALGRACDAREYRPKLESMSNGTLDDHADANTHMVEQAPRSKLSLTMPRQEKLTEDLTTNLLPPLTAYLHHKDESTVSLRVPVAVSTVKLLKILPPDELSARLPPVLTDISHILRSKSQDARDMTRKTLAEICALIGPAYFGFVLKELRSALPRGYQLHVLSFTVHSILVSTASIFQPGDLDYCLPQAVAIIMDDIFGATGQEKDAEDYISKMKEVKSSKSYDSMELLATTTAVTHLSDLIRPLQALLREKLNLQLVKKVDELLRRIGVGILRNNAVRSRDILMFCWEIISDVYKTEKVAAPRDSKRDYQMRRYLINLKGASKMENRGSTTSYAYKLAKFSLDVLRTVLHKYNELQSPSNLAGFIPLISDALVQSQLEVQMSAIRLLATIIKVPLPEIDQNAPVYVSEAVRIIKASHTTNTEIAQAALKLVSAILRERREVVVKETDLAYLLKRVKPDLDEPDRQGVTFNFLKSVMGRRIVIAEVYEVMDRVAEIMVTNQTRSARDLARTVYFQFIMEYPQGKDRFSKQLAFLIKNLDYKHQEGRQSVLEAIHLLLSKIGDNLIQEVVGSFFVPLVMMLVNDESAECREMAGALLKQIFERADEERTQTFLSLLRTWLNQDEQPLLTRLALQCYGLYYDVHRKGSEKELPALQERLLEILQEHTEALDQADWELLYYALQAFSRVCHLFPETAFNTNSASMWAAICDCLSFPHAWVKLSASRLLGLYLADFARANAETGLEHVPLLGSGGLELTGDAMLQLTRQSVGALRIPRVSEELASQVVRNLVFLGKSLGANNLPWKPARDHEDGDIAVQEQEDEEQAAINDASKVTVKSAQQYLFERLSAILRRETLTTRAPSLIPKTAALQLIAALCSHLSVEALAPSMQTILLPLHNLTDPSIAAPYSSDPDFESTYKTLVSTSQEVIALLQKKMGTTEFVAQMSKVRQGVRERREGRRVKRRIEAVADPEKMGREKQKKGERKKEKRKERSAEERGRRRGW
ncbi:MAG: hypothetical protein M1819_002426 [Sarea resinae]|nr:MAG: hypothetical protein M1819_002426 [Sarea resinae]